MALSFRSLCTRTAAAAAVAWLGSTGGVSAQGSFQTLDPFYGGESARHAFFDGFAVSGELGYRQRDLLGLSQPGAPAADLALSARVDYAVMPQVDVSAVVDLSGAASSGPLGLSWVVVKPYWRNESTDYAVRVAVDPASEGGLGFRQTDVAFLSSSAVSPTVSNDFALGIRRVRTGFVEDPTETLSDGGDAGSVSLLLAEERVRLVGQELRGSWGYNVLFDPAASRLSIGVVAESGSYAIVRSGQAESDGGAPERIQSSLAWLRGGVEFNRPSYQLAPYVSVPVVTWATVRGEPVRHGPRPDKARVGLRVTLR